MQGKDDNGTKPSPPKNRRVSMNSQETQETCSTYGSRSTDPDSHGASYSNYSYEHDECLEGSHHEGLKEFRDCRSSCTDLESLAPWSSKDDSPSDTERNWEDLHPEDFESAHENELSDDDEIYPIQSRQYFLPRAEDNHRHLEEQVSESDSSQSRYELGSESSDSEDYSKSESSSVHEQPAAIIREAPESNSAEYEYSSPRRSDIRTIGSRLQLQDLGRITEHHESVASEDESDSDSYDSEDESSSDGSEVSQSYMGSSGESKSYLDSSYDSSSSDYSDTEYDGLLGDMMGKTSKSAPRPLQQQAEPPTASLPIPFPTSSSGDDDICENPMAMFANIRAELEKVGRMIVADSKGEKFIERARILASVNMLSTNLPSCVLEHLGKEIKNKHERKAFAPRPSIVSTDWSSVDDMSFGDLESEASVHRSETNGTSDQGSSLWEAESYSSDSQSVDSESSDEESIRHEYLPSKMGKKKLSLGDKLSRLDQRATADVLQEALNASSNLDMHKFNPRLFRRTSAEHLHSEYLPVVSYFQCALLFIDISGFTSLSQSVDPETLSLIINTYFQAIVDKIFEFNGDVQKFAGDALFAEWRVTADRSMESCAQAAAACADALVRQCADFSFTSLSDTMSKQTEIGNLTVHCGLGAGEMAGIHVGDSEMRREYVYLGDPIKQAAEACDLAKHSEVKASRRFYQVLVASGMVTAPEESSDFFIVTSKKKTVLEAGPLAAASCPSKRNAKSRGVTEHVDGLEVEALKEYRRLMSLYVHPVVVSNDVAASDGFKSSRSNHVSAERHREEAELRTVYTMFINPKLELKLTGDIGTDGEAVDALNGVMNVVNRELKRFAGHLRQFIIDDKGIVLIATFGLRGSTFPNMVAERALPATCSIYNALQSELGVDSRIGATYGDAYCGAVGGEKRHEYAVMGPSVNLAARLMASHENPGILVDHAVRSMADQSFAFNALEPVEAKGYKEAVRIYEPLSSATRRWGRTVADFAGRQEELSSILTIARELFNKPRASSRATAVFGPSGMGKTALLSQSLDQIQKTIGIRGHKQILLLRHAGRESERDLPFGALRQILHRMLSFYGGIGHDENSLSTAQNSLRSNKSNEDQSSVPSARSSLDSTRFSVTKSLEIFSLVCSHLHARKDLQTAGRSLLFGAEKNAGVTIDQHLFQDLSNLFTEVVRHCVYNRRLTLLALDDAEFIDEMSWSVLEKVFKTVPNIFVLFSGSNFEKNSKVNAEFWNELTSTYMESGRFTSFELEKLSREDLTNMTLKSLGIPKEELDGDMVDELAVKSAGIPRFAREVLDFFKQRSAGKAEMGSSVHQIILNRIDSFENHIRTVLHIGAIIGLTFKVFEITAVMKGPSDKLDNLEDEVKKSVDFLCKEGILRAVVDDSTLRASKARGSQKLPISVQSTFGFCQNVWQKTILDLTLESRKRDVHRKLAIYYEDAEKMCPGDRLMKAHHHWLECRDREHTASTALQLCKILESRQDDHRAYDKAIIILTQTLSLWRFDSAEITGFTALAEELSWVLDEAELETIVLLLLELAQTTALAGRMDKSIEAFDHVNILKRTAEAEGVFIGQKAILPPLLEAFYDLESGYVKKHVCDFESRL